MAKDPNESNGQGMFRGLSPLGHGDVPWLIRFLYTFGIPAAVAVYLIWLMATRVENTQGTILELLRAHNADAAYSVRSNDAQNQQLNEIRAILQQICVNGAKTQLERNACFEAWRRVP